MPQKEFVLSEWVDKLSRCLQELVSYEQRLESELLLLRQRGEMVLGITGNLRHDPTNDIRERVSLYPLWGLDSNTQESNYRREISRKLSNLLEVLLEHPTLRRAVYTSNDQMVLGLDLAVSRTPAHQVIFILQALVEYALEHTPEATSIALADVIGRGETQDLIAYSIMVFRGLHVERRHDFQNGLSIISFDEARQHMSDNLVHSLLGKGTDAGQAPIGAVVSEVRWGPAIVPAGRDFEEDWPAQSETFREDALQLVELMAVAHELPVDSMGWYTIAVERRVEYLLGRIPYIFRVFSDASSSNTTNVIPSTTPVVSADRLSECVQLLSKIPQNDVVLRAALSRIASSLSRSGPHAVSDGIIDVAIALETMYQAGSELTYRLGTWASYFLEESAEDRLATYEKLKAFYKSRSDIVHGRRGGDENALKGGFQVARRTLYRLVLEGGPDGSAEWDQLVIAGGPE